MKMVRRLEKSVVRLVLQLGAIDDVVGLTHQLPGMQYELMD
jgi:hypothetical protein